MNRFTIVILSFTFVFSGTIALLFDGLKSTDDLIRLPLIPRRRRAAGGSGSTSVPLDDLQDVRYGIPLGIGTPPQQFSLILDTGSADLWVVPSSSGIKSVKNQFDESASSTFEGGKGIFFLNYAEVSVNGLVATDTITLGDLTVKGQRFGITNSTIADPYDGIMGFSYPGASNTDSSSLIDRLYEQGQIKKRVACVKAFHEAESKSQFIMGGCDVEPNQPWIPVLKVGSRRTGWRLNLTSIVLRSTEDNSEILTVTTNNQAVVDTGAGAGIGIPQKFLDDIVSKIGATWKESKYGKHYVVDCDKRKSLPDIDFYFGEAKLTIPKDDYSFQYEDECQLFLNKGGDDILFGDLFFNQATVIFDRDNDQVGLGPK